MRAVIISGRGTQDAETLYPFYRLQEAGYEVDLAAEGKQVFHGIQGVKFTPTTCLKMLKPHDYSILVIPGGVKAMEHMRLDEDLVQFVRDCHSQGLIVASICSGAQMLISAGLCKGRHISAYPAMKVDVENAGGVFVDSPAVADDRIVTSPHYRHLGAWMSAVLMARHVPSWQRYA
jgi:protease I